MVPAHMNRSWLTTLITGHVLTGTLAELPAANRITIRGGARLSIWLTYTRAALSVTGCPILRVEGSGVRNDLESPTDPTTITAWTSYPALDLSTYSAGRMSAFPLEIAFKPTAAGVSRWRLPDLDVLDLTFARLVVADFDGVNPGTLTVEYMLVVG